MRKIYTSIGALCALVLLLNPLRVAAQDLMDTAAVPPPFAGLLITEVQPGSVTSASDEFIELYNYSDQRIDFTDAGWRIDIASSNAPRWLPAYRSFTLQGSIAPGGTYVAASEYKASNSDDMVRYLPNDAAVWFSPGISGMAGHIRLVYQATDPKCDTNDHVIDTVEWTGTYAGVPTAASIEGRQIFTANSKLLDSRYSLQRITDKSGGYADTDNDMADFHAVAPTPGVAASHSPGLPNPIAWSDPTCTQPAPATGTSDEPSEPSETTTPPPTESSDGDGLGTDPAVPNPEDQADGGDAETAGVLLPPQLTELFPNPASPQTDAHDEYVELFNPNSVPLDIGGYTIEAGDTTKHDYTFPAGTMLSPQAYRAFYVTETAVGLTNDAGQVRLLDATGQAISVTDRYTNAPEGKSWTYVNGVWQWSVATPGLPNIAPSVPATAAAKPIATAKKTAAVKAASTKPAAAKKAPKAAAAKKTASKQPKTQVAALAPVSDTRRPVHGGILVSIGVIAVLYGAYEYRHDVANRIHKLRSNREVRRKNRAAAEGR